MNKHQFTNQQSHYKKHSRLNWTSDAKNQQLNQTPIPQLKNYLKNQLLDITTAQPTYQLPFTSNNFLLLLYTNLQLLQTEPPSTDEQTTQTITGNLIFLDEGTLPVPMSKFSDLFIPYFRA